MLKYVKTCNWSSRIKGRVCPINGENYELCTKDKQLLMKVDDNGKRAIRK